MSDCRDGRFQPRADGAGWGDLALLVVFPRFTAHHRRVGPLGPGSRRGEIATFRSGNNTSRESVAEPPTPGCSVENSRGRDQSAGPAISYQHRRRHFCWQGSGQQTATGTTLQTVRGTHRVSVVQTSRGTQRVW